LILLDSNVLSELMKDAPNPQVIDWLDRQPRTSIWTTSLTIFEIRFGFQILPSGKRQERLAEAFEILLAHKLERRIATFDSAAARHTADLMAARRTAGRPGDLRDSMIAGIALAANASLATRNTKHFDDLSIPIINPWS
jgi:toxin FitB